MRVLPPVRSPISPQSLKKGLRASLLARHDTLLDALLGMYRASSGVLTDSGTSALTLALRAVKTSNMTPVALPAYGCYDIVTAAVGADVPVVLYDLDPATLAPEPSSFEAALEAGARTVVIAHYFGVPVPADEIKAMLESREVLLIEDAAQEAGSTIDHRRAGSFGALSVLSFGRGKGLTGGSGGALLANDDNGKKLLERIGPVGTSGRGLRDVFAATALLILGNPRFYEIPKRLPGLRLGETVYHSPVPPAEISSAAAAIVEANIPLVQEEVRARRVTAGRLVRALASAESVSVIKPARKDVVPGWLRLPVLLAAKARPLARSQRASQLGVAGAYPRPLDRLEQIDPLLVERGQYPGAAQLAVKLFTVPTHGWVTDEDLADLEAFVESFE